jgi:hypothetical protein
MHAAQIVRLLPPSGSAGVRDAPARVIPFAPHAHRLAELHHQDSLQAEWDQLPILVAEAWSWRDPESVAAVEACVTRLKDLVLKEWAAD